MPLNCALKMIKMVNFMYIVTIKNNSHFGDLPCSVQGNNDGYWVSAAQYLSLYK